MEEEAVNLTVINEEIRTRKHTMRLCLGTDSDDKNGANIVVDQTPTPTRLIRNCEEVGLFEDLKHVNPFEETFRRAVEDAKTPDGASLMLPEGGAFASQAKIVSEDTLHTPHIFPSTYFVAESQERPKSPGKEKEETKSVREKRKWMPTNWKPPVKIEKPVNILPKTPTPQILQPAIVFPPTVIVKCVSPSLVTKLPPETSVAQTTSSIVKNRLRILCSEQKIQPKAVPVLVKKESTTEKDAQKNPNSQGDRNKGNKAAVKRYRAKLRTYQDFLKNSNQQLQDENKQLKEQNEKLKCLLRKHNISIPEELEVLESSK
uniref:BZIP domain-containing protein n=1 Tax=Phlebotomus papatasi TaxID=29031 RepID=A0A1B0DNA1_PHLPP